MDGMNALENTEVLVFWDSTCRKRWLVEERVLGHSVSYGKCIVNIRRPPCKYIIFP